MKISDKILLSMYKYYRKSNSSSFSLFHLKITLTCFLFMLLVMVEMVLDRIGIRLTILDGKPLIVALCIGVPLFFIVNKFLPNIFFFEESNLSEKDKEVGDFYSLIIMVVSLLVLCSILFL
jgi:hypothetical protein